MNVGLVIAGSLCLVLALGHTLVGRGVLDTLPRTLQPTRFGDGALTRGAVVFTWHGLGLMLTTTGAILIALASSGPPTTAAGSSSLSARPTPPRPYCWSGGAAGGHLICSERRCGCS